MSKMARVIRYGVGAAMLASALGLGIFGIATASRYARVDNHERMEGEYDEDHDFGGHDSEGRDEARLGTSVYSGAGMDTNYREECGSCHLAYPPGLLPSTSWNAIMNALDDHFGDNAELPSDLNAQITAFLDAHASDRGDRMKNARLLRDTKGDTPLRITDLPYFQAEHDEIPRRMVEDNPGVQSFSRCDACHQGAAKGRFDDDAIVIPGFSRWDD